MEQVRRKMIQQIGGVSWRAYPSHPCPGVRDLLHPKLRTLDTIGGRIVIKRTHPCLVSTSCEAGIPMVKLSALKTMMTYASPSIFSHLCFSCVFHPDFVDPPPHEKKQIPCALSAENEYHDLGV